MARSGVNRLRQSKREGAKKKSPAQVFEQGFREAFPLSKEAAAKRRRNKRRAGR